MRASDSSVPSPAVSIAPLNLNRMLFRQLFDRESCTYTYILADMTSEGKPAIVSGSAEEEEEEEEDDDDDDDDINLDAHSGLHCYRSSTQ